MATPYVSGMIGLLKTLEPGLTPEQVKQKLIDTSVRTDELKGFSISNGYVNALNLLR